ncbi:MAG: PQQ-binding-like beta-propeller repeat protein [Lachnospiraceae bacterium]|nr:PQQ-binding-like beta-propeller repeat protein [Lachnospiraceae bacterium]
MRRTGRILAAGALSLSILITGCGKPLSEPKEGTDAVTVFQSGDLTTEQKLLELGKPVATSATLPEIFGIDTALLLNGSLVDSYVREDTITFEGDYTQLEGVITFRGDNYRRNPSYGVADIVEKTLEKTWSVKTGRLKKTVKSGYWTGSGWTGQPLLVRWPEETRLAMNLYEEKKNKDGLVEVIYATMDGNIYFLDLEDGEPTRDKISLGFPVKGTGSLYPDGTPLYFVGAGDSMGEEGARTFVVDLIRGEIIYEYGVEDEFSVREDNNRFHAYDSSPLIDVETDTLIQPGENGILYTTKLNTFYNGTSVSIDPEEPVKLRYTTARSGEDSYWLGMEASAVTWNGYLYIVDNCADLLCIDLNTMEVVWTQDVKDDANATPVLDIVEEEQTAYLYVAPSLHFTRDKNSQGEIPLMKVNAATGEVVWQREYLCSTVDGVSGGVQATALVGQNNLSDLVYFVIARTGGKDRGKIVALDKKTGSEVWYCEMEHYSWSSPIALYDSEGNGYVILCDSDGNMFLLDGLTGEQYSKVNLGDNIEASPAAFENTIVVGTRGQKIYGVTVK